MGWIFRFPVLRNSLLGDDSSRWEYETEDESKLFGITGRASAFSGKVDFRLNYRHQKGNAQYETLDPSNVSGAFPDLETTIMGTVHWEKIRRKTP